MMLFIGQVCNIERYSRSNSSSIKYWTLKYFIRMFALGFFSERVRLVRHIVPLSQWSCATMGGSRPRFGSGSAGSRPQPVGVKVESREAEVSWKIKVARKKESVLWRRRDTQRRALRWRHSSSAPPAWRWPWLRCRPGRPSGPAQPWAANKPWRQSITFSFLTFSTTVVTLEACFRFTLVTTVGIGGFSGGPVTVKTVHNACLPTCETQSTVCRSISLNFLSGSQDSLELNPNGLETSIALRRGRPCELLTLIAQEV